MNIIPVSDDLMIELCGDLQHLIDEGADMEQIVDEVASTLGVVIVRD